MTLERGDTVWIPCLVTCGVFPDERLVSIESPSGLWTGVVDIGQLRDPIAAGPNAIRATVIDETTELLSARLPGQTTRREYLTISKRQSGRFLGV